MEVAEEFEVTINHHGIDRTVVVDFPTANLLLNDPDFAENYIESALNVNEEENDENSLLTVWNSKGKPNEYCHEATLLLLEYRQKYNTKFLDKKSNKIQLWKNISDEMRKYGYDVDGKKCQQKFANLQKSYLKFRDNMKTTGTDKKNPPPYYNEMHGLLGTKDKSDPKGLQDSFADDVQSDEVVINDIENDIDVESNLNNNDPMPSTSKECGNDNTPLQKIKNRFAHTRKIEKPKSTNMLILEEVKNQLEEERKEKKRHFRMMEGLLESQNNQRERMLNLFENMLERDLKKKRREDESDLDEN